MFRINAKVSRFGAATNTHATDLVLVSSRAVQLLQVDRMTGPWNGAKYAASRNQQHRTDLFQDVFGPIKPNGAALSILERAMIAFMYCKDGLTRERWNFAYRSEHTGQFGTASSQDKQGSLAQGKELSVVHQGLHAILCRPACPNTFA